jgi:hypothetical protein
MTPLATNSTEPADQSRWRGRLRLIGRLAVITLIAIVLFLMVMLYLNYSDQQRLADAIGEADRIDPGWRLNDILEARPPLSEEKNGARRLMAAFEAPHNSIDWSAIEYLSGLRPPFAMSQEKTELLRKGLTAARQSLAEARSMADYPRGRFLIRRNGNPLRDALPTGESFGVTELLRYDVFLRAQDGDMAGALASCRAMIHGSRYIGEEPSWLPTQYVRMSIETCTLWHIERVLAQGQPREQDLQKLQDLLREEESQPLFRRHARGERAAWDRVLELAQQGVVAPEELEKLLGWANKPRFATGWAAADELLDRIVDRQYVGSITGSRAALLEFFTQLVEISKLPLEQQAKRAQQLGVTLGSKSPFVRQVGSASLKIFENYHRYLARMRAALAMIAVERYRIKHGRWPDRLEDLVPDFLAQAPMDPFANATIRYVRDKDGVVIYSIGLDRTDGGGDIDSNHPGTSGTDLGFRLWDPDKRRQPPPPAKAEEKNP